MKLLATLASCAALVALGGVHASADIHVFDISGLSTDLGFGPSFPTLTHNFGAAGTVTGVAFDVTYESFSPSWRSEVQIAIDTDDDSSFDGDIDMSDFGAPNSAGVFSGAGSIPANSISSNGLVYLTLYESFLDASVSPDATFRGGSTVTVTYRPNVAEVPEPSSMAALALGMVGISLLRSRRRR